MTSPVDEPTQLQQRRAIARVLEWHLDRQSADERAAHIADVLSDLANLTAHRAIFAFISDLLLPHRSLTTTAAIRVAEAWVWGGTTPNDDALRLVALIAVDVQDADAELFIISNPAGI